MYKRVAEESPHGDGSLSMLENLLSRWKGKMFVLILLGFVATSFIITITLSAADATAHIVENPFVHEHLKFLDHPVPVTLVLIGLLGLVFLRGFNEAIGIAVGIVALFLTLNLITIARAVRDRLGPVRDLPELAGACVERSGGRRKCVVAGGSIVMVLSKAGARTLGIRDGCCCNAARQER